MGVWVSSSHVVSAAPSSSGGGGLTRLPCSSVGSLPRGWFCWLIAEGAGTGMEGCRPIPLPPASPGGGQGSARPAANLEWHPWGSGDGTASPQRGSITLGMGEHHARGLHGPRDGLASFQGGASPQGCGSIAPGAASPWGWGRGCSRWVQHPGDGRASPQGVTSPWAWGSIAPEGYITPGMGPWLFQGGTAPRGWGSIAPEGLHCPRDG